MAIPGNRRRHLVLARRPALVACLSTAAGEWAATGSGATRPGQLPAGWPAGQSVGRGGLSLSPSRVNGPWWTPRLSRAGGGCCWLLATGARQLAAQAHSPTATRDRRRDETRAGEAVIEWLAGGTSTGAPAEKRRQGFGSFFLPCYPTTTATCTAPHKGPGNKPFGRTSDVQQPAKQLDEVANSGAGPPVNAGAAGRRGV